MPIVNTEVPKARVAKGISTPVAVTAGIVVLALLGTGAYFVVRSFENSQIGSTLESSMQQIAATVARQSEVIQQESATKVTASIDIPTAQPAVVQPTPAAKEQSVSKGTYDIGAYLTYGGKASLLNRAVARLSTDRMRLAVGMFEESQGNKERPALAVVFEFKSPQATCSKSNIRELALMFNLKAMGDIAAQQVQIVKKSPSEIGLALENFSCDLKPGGKLTLYLLGADPKLLKPVGSTFGWGVRLVQEIG